MLVFPANITNPRPFGRPGRGAGHVVKPLRIGPAEVIDHRLPEIVTVGQRLSGDFSRSRIGHFEFSAPVLAAAQQFDIVGKLVLQVE